MARLRWVESVPAAILHRHPTLAVEHIVDMWMKHRLDEGRFALDELEASGIEELELADSDGDLRRHGVTSGRLTALRAMFAGSMLQDPDEVADLAREALTRLAPDD